MTCRIEISPTWDIQDDIISSNYHELLELIDEKGGQGYLRKKHTMLLYPECKQEDGQPLPRGRS